MPNSAVYQPTTVTYEQEPIDPRWTCPITCFSHRCSCTLTWILISQLAMSVLGGLLTLSGIGLLVAGAVQYHVAEDEEVAQIGINALIAGGVILVVGILCLSWCSMSWPAKININKELHSSGVSSLNTLNPSSDPLVASQYVSISEAPPVPDDEMRNLMDNKDCMSSAEESDKMLDGRPSLA